MKHYDGSKILTPSEKMDLKKLPIVYLKIIWKKIKNPHEAYGFPSALILKLQSVLSIFK